MALDFTNLDNQNQYVGHLWYLAKIIKMVTFYRNKDWIQFLISYEIVVSKYLILYLIFYIIFISNFKIQNARIIANCDWLFFS